MTNKIILVTDPDDVLLDGTRILLVNLDTDQSSLLSNFFKEKNFSSNYIVYIARPGDAIDWILDKKIKSDYIIFNANHDCDIINGYLAAQKNSWYFGTLRDLYRVNNNVVYNHEDLGKIFNHI